MTHTSTPPEVPVSSFETAALLFALGHRLVRTESTRTGRAVLFFENPNGEAGRAILLHESEGMPVNSLRFEIGLKRAKDTIFAARRSGGLD